MDDLIAWLKARLDEDEALAHAACDEIHGCDTRRWETATLGGVVDAVSGEQIADTFNRYVAGAHIARHDPESVLADIRAKRILIEYLKEARYLSSHNGGTYPLVTLTLQSSVNIYESAVRAIAQGYAGQPGWQEEWGQG